MSSGARIKLGASSAAVLSTEGCRSVDTCVLWYGHLSCACPLTSGPIYALRAHGLLFAMAMSGSSNATAALVHQWLALLAAAVLVLACSVSTTQAARPMFLLSTPDNGGSETTVSMTNPAAAQPPESKLTALRQQGSKVVNSAAVGCQHPVVNASHSNPAASSGGSATHSSEVAEANLAALLEDDDCNLGGLSYADCVEAAMRYWLHTHGNGLLTISRWVLWSQISTLGCHNLSAATAFEHTY